MEKNLDLSYYTSVRDTTNIEVFRNEFEIWLNANKDFILLWESFFNETPDIGEDYIEFDSFAKSKTMSLLVNPNNPEDYYIHPQILLAFSIEDPVFKLNLLVSIFDLPNDVLGSFLNSIFGFDEDDEDDEDDSEK